MQLNIRPITKEDYPLTMAWRSNSIVYQGLYQQSQGNKGVTWDEHVKWNNGRNQDWRTFIVIYEERPIGVLTIGQLDNWSPEIALYIGETSLWGKGIGKEILKLGIEWIREYAEKHQHVKAIWTTILDSNERSIRLFTALGFKRIADARPQESRYSYWLGEMSNGIN